MRKEQTALEKIRAEMEQLPGHLGFYYKNLATGETYGVNAEEAYLAASVIKLPIFLHVLREIAEGRMTFEERIAVGEVDKMPSCGALSLLTGEYTMDVRSLLNLMIDLSDNTATNLLIRRCGIEELNRSFAKMGLEKTVIRRRLFDSAAAARGIENTICPKEMADLLEALFRGAFVSEEVSEYALGVLKKQQIRHKIRGKLSYRFPVANKTGEDENLSNDVGIVYAKEPFIVCWTGHGTDVYRWEDLIRRGSALLADAQE